MARSLLPNPLRVLIEANKNQPSVATSALVTNMILDGGDRPTPLETAESPDTKYLLSFKVDEKLPASEPFLLSWGIIEQLRDKKYVTPTIDEAIEDINKIQNSGSNDKSKNTWPFVGDFSPLEGVANDQPKTDVQVTFTQYHPLLNTVCAEINPWCLMVNQLKTTLLVKTDEDVFSILPHSVLVPPGLTNKSFQLGIYNEIGDAQFSTPLQLTDQEWHFQSLMPSVEGLVPLEGVCHCKIVLDQSQICLLTIRTNNENGMRVIDIIPTLLLVNETQSNLNVGTVSLFGQYEADSLHYHPYEVNASETSPLFCWHTIGTKSDGLFDGFQHMAFSMEGTMWSELLNLDDCRNLTTDTKKCLSLPFVNPPSPGEASNRILVVTLHPREGQVFIVVQEEQRPHYLIHNSLQIPLYFAASSNGE